MFKTEDTILFVGALFVAMWFSARIDRSTTESIEYITYDQLPARRGTVTKPASAYGLNGPNE